MLLTIFQLHGPTGRTVEVGFFCSYIQYDHIVMLYFVHIIYYDKAYIEVPSSKNEEQ